MEKNRREIARPVKNRSGTVSATEEDYTTNAGQGVGMAPRQRGAQLRMPIDRLVRGVKTTKTSSMTLPQKNRRVIRKMMGQQEPRVEYDQYGYPIDPNHGPGGYQPEYNPQYDPQYDPRRGN